MRLNENHWGAIAKLHLYTEQKENKAKEEKQQQQNLLVNKELEQQV